MYKLDFLIFLIPNLISKYKNQKIYIYNIMFQNIILLVLVILLLFFISNDKKINDILTKSNIKYLFLLIIIYFIYQNYNLILLIIAILVVIYFNVDFTERFNNNKYLGFPPLMSDGRSVTASYQPEAVLNNELIKTNNIQSNWQYRKFLTENSKQIMEYNFREASNDAGYFKRYSGVPINNLEKMYQTNTPYLFDSVMDDNKPFGYDHRLPIERKAEA